MKSSALMGAHVPSLQIQAMLGDVVAVTPAGTVIGNATPITSTTATAVLADAAVTAGSQLPVPALKGERVTVVNGGSNSTNIYPPTGYAINNGTVNVAVTLSPKGMATFTAVSVGGNYSTTSTALSDIVANVTPVGTTIGAAAAVTSSFTVLADAAANTGVILPANVTGLAIDIVNGSANVTKVYPPVNGKINGGTANASVSVSGVTMVRAKAYSALDWGVTGIS